jgi:hypothetical protein
VVVCSWWMASGHGEATSEGDDDEGETRGERARGGEAKSECEVMTSEGGWMILDDCVSVFMTTAVSVGPVGGSARIE